MNKFQQKISQLSQEISQAAQKYYTDGTSDLSDAEFDAKVDELKTLDPNNPAVTQTGWGYDVMEDTTPGQKVKHKYGRAGSLDKIRTGDEFRRAFKASGSVSCSASLKLDGISVVLYYKEGKLYQALTRGDGEIGIDITEKAKIIEPNAVELLNDNQFTGAVRGEIVMSFDNFQRASEKNPEFKNPRNATAGIINRKEITDDLNFLSIVVYSVVGCESDSEMIRSNSDMWDFLSHRFMQVAPHFCWLLISADNIDSEMDKLQTEWYGCYPADGIVITKEIQLSALPYVSYDAVAYKFPSEAKETTVIEVEWNLSKTNYVVPRVKVEAVELAGTTVQYATGFNAKYIADNRIGKGARVQITKRGEIIPYIVAVLKSAEETSLPMTCPSCGEPLRWNGVHIQCENKQCGNLNRQDLSIWLETLAPVEGLKDDLRSKYLNKIIPTGVYTIENFMYFIKDISLDVFGSEGHEGLMRKMLEVFISESKFSISQALRALNIPRFGDVTCDKFARDPKQAEELLSELVWAPDALDKFKLVDYIGGANASALIENRYKLGRLTYIWFRIYWRDQPAAQARTLVAITGKLSVKRADFEKELEAYGFKAVEISPACAYLITDNPNSNSGKNQKADKWNIPKISEENFRKDYMHE